VNNNPIGIFDSGVGGLTVWSTLLNRFEQESFVYVSDSSNCPYGNKTDKKIIELSIRIVDFLIKKKCKLIVVACNTATSAAIYTLRDKYNIPIIGIEPAIKPASLLSKTGSIGVLATKGTVSGMHFKTTAQKFANDKNVITQIGYGLVDQVENNLINTEKTSNLLKEYIEPMLNQDVDYIVLGCTHYPLLSEEINKITKGKVILLEPSEAIATQMQKKLEEHNLASTSQVRITTIYTTGDNFLTIENVLNQLKIDSQENIKLKRWL